MFVFFSLGSFQVHIPVNECKSCGSYVVILSVINTADSVCVRVCIRNRKRNSRKVERQGGVLACVY